MNSNIDQHFEEQLWAYVHGELPEQDKKEIESLLADAQARQALLLQIRQLHQLLPDACIEESNVTSLADKIESLYDRDQHVASTQSENGSRGLIIHFPQILTRRWKLVVAAAAILIVSAIVLTPTTSVKWESPNIQSLCYRGSDIDPAKSNEALRINAITFAKQLRRSTARSLRDRGIERRSYGQNPIILSLSLTQNRDGTLLAEIVGKASDDNIIGTWQIEGAGIEALEELIQSVTTPITDAVWSHYKVYGDNES